jgi:signal peptidase II
MRGGPVVKGRRYLILLFVSLVLVLIDQIVKIYIHTGFELHESVQVIPGYFNITYVRNTGAAFGIFSKSHELFRQIFFLSIPPIAVGIILYFMYSVAENDWLQIYALSFISGGAIGNYIDRVRFGYVVDFLDFHFQNIYSWPAFNVADSAIVGGVSVLFLILIKEMKLERDKKKLKTS